jgi:transcription initiation factor TFIID subunit 1
VEGQWKVEIIRDIAVIHAYIKKRQAIEEEAQMTNTLAPTGDADKDARAKRRSFSDCFDWCHADLLMNLDWKKRSQG